MTKKWLVERWLSKSTKENVKQNGRQDKKSFSTCSIVSIMLSFEVNVTTHLLCQCDHFLISSQKWHDVSTLVFSTKKSLACFIEYDKKMMNYNEVIVILTTIKIHIPSIIC